MPSPIGHALAGVTAAWLAEAVSPVSSNGTRSPVGRPVNRTRSEFHWQSQQRQPANEPGYRGRAHGWLPVIGGIVATTPDLDLLIGAHRSASHSLGAALIITSVALAVAAWMNLPILRTAGICGLAYASHVALDWLGTDSASPAGLMALWPVTRTYFVSGLDLFDEVSRRYWRFDEFVVGNLRALLWEILLLAPIATLAWLLGPRRRQRGVAGPGESRSASAPPARN